MQFPPLHVPGEMWHVSGGDVQEMAVPVHVPFWHANVSHASVPVHAVPFAFVGFEHDPVPVSHVPAVWQESIAVHVTAVPPHTPPVQTSPVVHALPSLQLVPSVAAGFEQDPVAGLHVPATWHWSLAMQVVGVPVMHTPLLHAMVPVQAFPPQPVPSGAAGFEQVPLLGLHTPATWQSSLAVHTTGMDPVHAPLLQE